jgi:hypothetical protein
MGCKKENEKVKKEPPRRVYRRDDRGLVVCSKGCGHDDWVVVPRWRCEASCLEGTGAGFFFSLLPLCFFPLVAPPWQQHAGPERGGDDRGASLYSGGRGSLQRRALRRGLFRRCGSRRRWLPFVKPATR